MKTIKVKIKKYHLDITSEPEAKEYKELIEKIKQNTAPACLLTDEEWEYLISAGHWIKYNYADKEWVDNPYLLRNDISDVYRIHPDWEQESKPEYFYGKRVHSVSELSHRYIFPDGSIMNPVFLPEYVDFIGWKFDGDDYLRSSYIRYRSKSGTWYTGFTVKELKSGKRVKVVASHAVFKVGE
jgi:hypothetical protein